MDQRWMRRGACLDVEDRSRWTSGDPLDRTAAKRICRECVVRVECLAWALGNQDDHYVFGGFDGRERARLAGVLPHPDSVDDDEWLERVGEVIAA